MKVYQCDACGKVMKNPYEENMIEFSVACTFDYIGVFPMNIKNRTRVDLCKECYHGLHLIAEMKRSADNGKPEQDH